MGSERGLVLKLENVIVKSVTDGENCSKKTVWIALLLLQMYQAFLSLGYCIFVESGTTSEVSIIGKNQILPVLLLCPNGCRIIICCATFISAIATDILTFHFNKYSP